MIGYEEDGWARITVRNRFSVGDRLEIIHPSGNLDIPVTELHSSERRPQTVAPGSGHTVCLPLPAGYEGAFLARYLEEGVSPAGNDPGPS